MMKRKCDVLTTHDCCMVIMTAIYGIVQLLPCQCSLMLHGCYITATALVSHDIAWKHSLVRTHFGAVLWSPEVLAVVSLATGGNLLLDDGAEIRNVCACDTLHPVLQSLATRGVLHYAGGQDGLVSSGVLSLPVGYSQHLPGFGPKLSTALVCLCSF